MTATGLGIPARQRHVEIAQLVDLEALADSFDTAERLEQRLEAVGRKTEHLDVDVAGFIRKAKQPIANPAADDQCAAARGANRFSETHSVFERRHAERLPAKPLHQSIRERRSEGVHPHQCPRRSMRKDLGHRSIDRAGNRIGHAVDMLTRT